MTKESNSMFTLAELAIGGFFTVARDATTAGSLWKIRRSLTGKRY